MRGLSGPFKFEVDEVGTSISWDDLSKVIQEELIKEGHSRDNSEIYLAKVAVFPSDHLKEKHDNWQKVKRVFIEVVSPSKKILIRGISPRNKRVGELSQLDFAYVQTLDKGVTLFNALQFKLDVSHPVKVLSRNDRFAVLSSFTSRKAQWVFSDGWDEMEFSLYLFTVLPTNLDKEERFIEVTIKPTREKSKRLTQLEIWKKKVDLS